MKKAKYIVKPTTQFKRDYKLAMKRGLDVDLLEEIIAALAMDKPLPENNKHISMGDVFTPPIFFTVSGEIFYRNFRIYRFSLGAVG